MEQALRRPEPARAISRSSAVLSFACLDDAVGPVWQGPSSVENNHYPRIRTGCLRHQLEAEPALPKLLLPQPIRGWLKWWPRKHLRLVWQTVICTVSIRILSKFIRILYAQHIKLNAIYTGSRHIFHIML